MCTNRENVLIDHLLSNLWCTVKCTITSEVLLLQRGAVIFFQENNIFDRIMKKLIQGGVFGSWREEDYSWIDARLQPYLLGLGWVGDWVYDEKGTEALGNLFYGDIYEDNLNDAKSTLGYSWENSNGKNRRVIRTRQYLHKTKRFEENDPYKQLYDLADSDSVSGLWLDLENCQQNRTKAGHKCQ